MIGLAAHGCLLKIPQHSLRLFNPIHNLISIHTPNPIFIYIHITISIILSIFVKIPINPPISIPIHTPIIFLIFYIQSHFSFIFLLVFLVQIHHAFNTLKDLPLLILPLNQINFRKKSLNSIGLLSQKLHVRFDHDFQKEGI